MNMTKYKRIIAREWLIFLIAIIVGVIFSVIVYFKDSSDYLSNRDFLYHSLKYEYKENKRYHDIPELKGIINRFSRYYLFEDDSSIVSKLAVKYPDEYEYLPKKIKLSDSLFSFMSFTEFSKIIDDESSRKLFYDTIRTNSHLGNYEKFENEYIPETFYDRLLRLHDHLFSSYYKYSTLFSLLVPYLLFQLLRSIYYSIKSLLKNKKTP
ncbi:MAG: hypothetical protein AB1521_16595 [Bacteroidota bacterium]